MQQKGHAVDKEKLLLLISYGLEGIEGLVQRMMKKGMFHPGTSFVHMTLVNESRTLCVDIMVLCDSARMAPGTDLIALQARGAACAKNAILKLRDPTHCLMLDSGQATAFGLGDDVIGISFLTDADDTSENHKALDRLNELMQTLFVNVLLISDKLEEDELEQRMTEMLREKYLHDEALEGFPETFQAVRARVLGEQDPP